MSVLKSIRGLGTVTCKKCTQAVRMSSYQYSRKYVGPAKAVVLDWSGTTIDKYVLAPVVVFVEVFKKHNVPISMAEARKPMGLRKDMHVKAVAESPEVRERWKKVHGQYPTQEDIDKIYKESVPMQLEVLRQNSFCDLLPGALDSVDTLRSKYNLKIGVTTGFTKAMTEIVLESVKKQGYVPDAAVAGDEVLHGSRPKPFMIYRVLDMLDVHPIQSVIKVDDTVVGIEEGQEAGCWTVGVARWSNYMDIDSLEQEKELSAKDIEKRLEKSKDTLRKAGPHYVVDSIADLPGVVEDINKRLANGETPY